MQLQKLKGNLWAMCNLIIRQGSVERELQTGWAKAPDIAGGDRNGIPDYWQKVGSACQKYDSKP